MYFTYCPVQIYKIMFRRFLFSRIWSSAQDYAVLRLLLNPVVISGFITQPSYVLDFHLTECVRRKWFVLAVYQFWKGISAGLALKYFTWFIAWHRGGMCIWHISQHLTYRNVAYEVEMRHMMWHMRSRCDMWYTNPRVLYIFPYR